MPWKMPHSNKVPKCIVGFLPPRPPMPPEVASTKPRHGLLPPSRAALPKSFQNSSEGASNFARRPIHNTEYFWTPHRAARPRESILVLPYLRSSVVFFGDYPSPPHSFSQNNQPGHLLDAARRGSAFMQIEWTSTRLAHLLPLNLDAVRR